MEYTSVSNPRYANKIHTKINVDVVFVDLGTEPVSYTASADTNEPSHTQELFSRALAGDFGPVEAWVQPPDITGEEALNHLRNERTALLEQTDYVENLTYWNTLSEEKQAEWTTYRNALRDMPANNPDAILRWNEPDGAETGSYTEWVNVTWPVKPA